MAQPGTVGIPSHTRFGCTVYTIFLFSRPWALVDTTMVQTFRLDALRNCSRVSSMAPSPAVVQRPPSSALAVVNRRLRRPDHDRSTAAYLHSRHSPLRAWWHSGSLSDCGHCPFVARSKAGPCFALSGRAHLVARAA